MMRQYDTISREFSSLISKLKTTRGRIEGFIGNITFDYEEQELIRRVFKSVLPQMKHDRDKETAKIILRKTEWID